ncbi:hypothetical protein FACS1894193_09600 [Bacilli bacterium]|nr:hypothetical protein FACS1894192_06610 [Bacilli bacterium]GHU43171.1 hypothetical protein FACS1894193_09600 [Bacilli bacterium]
MLNYDVMLAKTQVTDIDYFLELINDSPANRMLLNEKIDIIEKCMVTAQKLWEDLQPSNVSFPISLIERSGYRLVEDSDFTLLPIFAVCDPNDKTVVMNTKAIAKTSAILEEWSEIDGKWTVDFKSLVLWHEIFHMLEEEDETIYTRRPILEKYFWGRRRRLPLDCASEIGAIYFSKLATNLSFNPRVFEGMEVEVFDV